MWLPDTTSAGVLLALVLASTAPAKVQPGQMAPDLAGFNLEGELPTLEGRIVVLDVWASWCAPCKASFPALADLHRDFAEQGVVVLGVSVDREQRQYVEFVRRHAPPFPVVRDATFAFARAFEPAAMPTTYVIDRQGRVRGVHRGFHGQSSVKQLRLEVAQLLEEDA